MAAGMLAFACGAVGAQFLPALPEGPGWLALAAGALLILRPGPRPAGLLCLGLLWGAVHGQWALGHRLPASVEGRDLILEGRIVGIPRQGAAYTSFILAPERIDGFGDPLPRRVKLGWYGEAPPLTAGERWRLRVRLKRPHGLMNPGGFDYERWAFAQRIDAGGYVREPATAVRLAPGTGLSALRQDWAGRLHRRLEGSPAAGVLVALVMGERQYISDPQWEVLRRTGTSHLVAISGLHVGMLAGLAALLAGGVWRWLPGAALRIPAPVAAAGSAVVAAVGYSALAGFALPTQRALVMLTVPALALLLRRGLRPWRGFCLALVAVLVWDPFAPLAAGFWLSFGAVAILLAVGSDRSRPSLPARVLGLQCAVGVGLLPLTAYWFQQGAWLGPLVNLLAIPLVTLLLVPSALLGSALHLLAPGAVETPLELARWTGELLLSGLESAAALPLAAGDLRPPSALGLGLAVAGVLVLLAPPGVVGRVLGLGLLAPLLLRPANGAGDEVLRLAVLDVGQGTAVVLRAAGRTLVYDAGPAGFGRDSGAEVVLPFLRAEAVERVDALVISHGDNDHAGGAAAVVSGVPTAAVWMGEPVPGLDGRRCRAGQGWQWGGMEFRFLWPPPESLLTGNNASCVLRVQAGDRVLLLAGDIEAAVEAELLRRDPAALAADVLLVPHHGSRTSSGPAFVAAVDPDLALFSVGYRNRWAFPRPEVALRYRVRGAQLLRTDLGGALLLEIGPTGLSEPRRYRAEAARYYHAPAEM